MSWAQIQELLMIWWNNLQWYLTYAHQFLRHYVDSYHHQVIRFFDNHYTQVVRMKDEFWLNYRDVIERRGQNVTFYSLGFFATTLKWYLDWNSRFNLVFDGRWSYTQIILDLYATRIVTLAETVWKVIDNIALSSGQQVFDLTQNMFVYLFNLVHYDRDGIIAILDRYRIRINGLVGMRADRVEGVIGADFNRLYQMIAGSYPRLHDLTIAKNTSIWDLLNVSRPMIDLLARQRAAQALTTVNLLIQDFRIFTEDFSKLWSSLYFFTSPNRIFIADWIKEKVFPIANDPLGWLEAWLKQFLLSRGEAFLRWVFGT